MEFFALLTASARHRGWEVAPESYNELARATERQRVASNSVNKGLLQPGAVHPGYAGILRIKPSRKLSPCGSNSLNRLWLAFLCR